MNDNNYEVTQFNYFLEPGYIFIASQPSLISTVLGSCVAICLYDRKRKTGGMNHFALPSIQKQEAATAHHGNVATLALIRMMLEDGSKIKHLEAQLLGGAHNPQVSPVDIGRKNVMIARRILSKKGIHISSEDTGGSKGRKVVFNTDTNEIAILKVERLRQSDWYPYEGQR